MPTIAADPVDRIYDDMRTEKVYIQPGMSCYAEFIEGVPVEKRRLLTTKNPHAMSLDEWADRFHTGVSELIGLLSSATFVGKRRSLESKQLEDYRDFIEEQEATQIPDFTPESPIAPGYPPDTLSAVDKQPDVSKPNRRPSPSWPPTYSHSPTCPKCGSSMILRHGKYGNFYGCADYPECDGVLSLRKAKQQGFAVPSDAMRENRQQPPRKPPDDPRQTAGDGDWWGKRGDWLFKILSLLLAAFIGYSIYKLGAISSGFFGGLMRVIGVSLFVVVFYSVSKRSQHIKQALENSVPLTGDKDRVHASFSDWFHDKLHSWRVWIVIGSIAMSLMGMVGFAEFMFEEAGQQAGFACFVLKSGGLAEEAFLQVEKLNILLDKMERFTNTFGWISPFNYEAYKQWIKAARENANATRLWAIAKNPQLAESVLSSEVIEVIDGDSLVLATGEEIRLSGINAPEWYAHGGREAEAWLKALVLHKVVDIRRIKQGYYGRIIADISINGQDVSTALVKAGMAKALDPSKVAEIDGAEGAVTKIASGRILNGGYLLLVGDPINVFILPDAAESLHAKQFNGMTVEALGKMKLYNGLAEVVVDDPANITIVEGG